MVAGGGDCRTKEVSLLIKVKSMKLSWQYFLSYFVVMLAAMGMLIVFVYNSFYQFHSQLLLGEYQSRLELLRETQESELTNLWTINNQIATSSEAEPFHYQQEPAKAQLLIEKLATLKAASQYISNVFIRYYDENYVFSQTSSYSIDNFMKSAVVFQDISIEKLLDYWNNTTQMTMLPTRMVEGYGFGVYNDRQQFVTVFLPFDYYHTWRSGTVMYLINQNTYKKWFSSIISDTADVYIMNGSEPLVYRAQSGVPVSRLEETDVGKRGERC